MALFGQVPPTSINWTLGWFLTVHPHNALPILGSLSYLQIAILPNLSHVPRKSCLFFWFIGHLNDPKREMDMVHEKTSLHCSFLYSSIYSIIQFDEYFLFFFPFLVLLGLFLLPFFRCKRFLCLKQLVTKESTVTNNQSTWVKACTLLISSLSASFTSLCLAKSRFPSKTGETIITSNICPQPDDKSIASYNDKPY